MFLINFLDIAMLIYIQEIEFYIKYNYIQKRNYILENLKISNKKYEKKFVSIGSDNLWK